MSEETIKTTPEVPEILKAPRHQSPAISILTWFSRIIIGAVFVFSGMSKGLDVWGTIYKFGDYWAAMNMSVWESLNVVGVFALCMFEFLTGVFLLLGCFRRFTPIFAALIMAFMLPLSFWVANWNPVADCGCFGDALKLSNWATFWKNVVICLFVVWLLIYNRKSAWIITPYLQWIAAVVSGAYFIIIAWLGYYYQPLMDFRPYPVGDVFLVPDSSDDNIDESEFYVFVYEKDGQKKEFRIDDELPDEDDGWQFVEKKLSIPEGASQIPDTVEEEPNPKSIHIWDSEDDEDMTSELAEMPKVLYLMIPDLSEVPAAKTFKINSLYDWCKRHGIEMVAVVGGGPEEIEKWKDISLAEYPIYKADDTAIKEVVRGNPAVVYTENNRVEWKSSLRAIDVDDFLNPSTSSDPKSFGHDNALILRNLTWIYIAVIAILILLSLTTQMGRISKNRNRLRISKLNFRSFSKRKITLKKKEKNEEEENAG